MTTPITQADREAAASYWKVSRIGNSETQRRYLSGEADNSFIVQAFAAHRIAAERETVVRIAEWLRETAPQYSHNELSALIEQGYWRND